MAAEKVYETVDDYQKYFDPERYLEVFHNPTYFSEEAPEPCRKFMERNEAVQDFVLQGNLGGERALVVGSGPSIHELTYLVPHYRQFVVSDIVESSLQAIRAWRDREPGAYEWAPFFKHYAARAGCGENWEEHQKMVRAGIVDVVIGDLLKEDPFEGRGYAAFDAIVAPQCLGALHTTGNATKAIRNLTEKYLKPGGYFLTLGVSGTPFYQIPIEKFKWMMTTTADYERMHSDAGLGVVKVREFITEEGKDPSNAGPWTFTALLARKPNI